MPTNKKIALEDFENEPVLRERAHRSLEVARALDAKAERLPHAVTLTFYEFSQFIQELTPKRLELLRLASKKRRSAGS